MSTRPNPFINPEQYLAIERKAESRSEYFNGQMFAMLELGRSDHPFRTNDSVELADFMEQVAVVLARLGAARRLHGSS